LRFLERRPGRTAGEERVIIATGEGKPAAHGLWFTARPNSGLRAWADLIVSDLAVLPEIAGALDPGSSLMVAYEGDETEAALPHRLAWPCSGPAAGGSRIGTSRKAAAKEGRSSSARCRSMMTGEPARRTNCVRRFVRSSNGQTSGLRIGPGQKRR